MDIFVRARSVFIFSFPSLRCINVFVRSMSIVVRSRSGRDNMCERVNMYLFLTVLHHYLSRSLRSMHSKSIPNPSRVLASHSTWCLKIKALKLNNFFLLCFLLSALLKPCTSCHILFFSRPKSSIARSLLYFLSSSLSSLAFLRPSIDDIVDVVGCSLPCIQHSTF